MAQVPAAGADLSQPAAPKEEFARPATSFLPGREQEMAEEDEYEEEAAAASCPTCTAGSAVLLLPSDEEDEEWGSKSRARPEANAEISEACEPPDDGRGERSDEAVGGASSSAAAATATATSRAAGAAGAAAAAAEAPSQLPSSPCNPSSPSSPSDPILQSVLASYDRFVEAMADTEFFRHFSDLPMSQAFPMVTVAACYGLVASSFALTLPSTSMAAIFGGLFAGSASSLYKGVITDPGKIPEEWRDCPPTQDIHERKKKGAGEELRFCQKEQKYKPDRAHYCRQLRRNVLRMDHFCPFLANCIGHRNHKHFYLFLLYTALAIVFADVRLLAVLLQGSAHGAPLAAMQQFLVGNGIVVSTVVSAVMVPFVGFHSWLLSRNMTTIEYYETYRSRREITYDIGLFENIRSVFGEEWWLWLLPIKGPNTDGLTFPVRPALPDDEEDDEEGTQPRAPGATGSTQVAAVPRPPSKKFSEMVKAACGPLPILPGAACAAEEIFGDIGSLCVGLWSGATLRLRSPTCKGFPDGFTGSERQRPEARAEDAARVQRIAEMSWQKSGKKAAHASEKGKAAGADPNLDSLRKPRSRQ